MPYGILKVDTITFTNGGVDQSITVSGIVASTSGNLTVTGTVSGNVIRGGTTVSGATVTGSVGQFGNLTAVSGVFTTQISGSTVTGNVGQFTSVTGGTAGFTTVTGTTVTGTTANFVTVSGTTVTGTTANFTSGNFTSISGGTHIITSGVFAAGSATNPSISFASDPNTGIYSPGADQVAISTNGTGKLFINSSGVIEAYNTASSGTGIITGLKLNSARAVGGDGTEITWNLDFPTYSSLAGIAGVFSGSGNNGHLVFKTVSSGSYAERMRLDSSGRLGLGTSSPAVLIHGSVSSGAATARLESTANSGEAGLQLYGKNSGGTVRVGQFKYDSTDYFRIGTTGAVAFAFETSDTERMRIDSSGRVGIGTTTPSESLHVSGGRGRFASGTNFLDVYHNGTTAYLETTGGASTALGFATGGSERGRFDTSGRFLVGTSSARSNTFSGSVSQTFQIEGNTDTGRGAAIFSTVNGQPGGYLLLGHSKDGTIGGNALITNGDDLGLISFQGNDGSKFVEGARISAVVDGTSGVSDLPTRLVFSTTADGASSPTERMRLDNAGNLGLGVTPTAVAGNGRTFQYGSNVLLQNVVSTQASFSSNAIYDGAWKYITADRAAALRIGATNAGEFTFNVSNAVGTAGGTISNWDSNVALRVTNAGAINFGMIGTTASAANAFIDSGNSNNVLRSTSSLRYKTDIEDVEDSRSDALLSFRPVWYRSLAGDDRKDWSWYGLIAEEVAAIEPRLVHWGYTQDSYEEIDGKFQLKAGAKLVPDGVQYDRITVLLLDLVQKQNERIETLEAKVAALEGA